MPYFIFFEQGKQPTKHSVSRFPEDVDLFQANGTKRHVYTASIFPENKEYFYAYEKGSAEPSEKDVLDAAKKLDIPPVIRHI
ncbi:hypothetical protein NM578_003053 [Enterobacter hormaechei]|nr:hypothetical protein [Enterobacter hormaechei]ELC6584623.1 hypothetical protein [Enterobacter hormaechei]MCM7579832.1 hypothetical protein [Enterobacter hormaechei]